MFRPRLFAMGVLVAAFAVFATSVPASAHDALIGSTPEPGARLTEAPAEVSLRFSDDVLTLGAAVIVADGAGRDWVVGDVRIAGNSVSAALDGPLPEAGYELRWRVVSSDGHPISGLVPFTVGEGAPLVRSTADNDGESGNTGSTGNNTNDDGANNARPDVVVDTTEPAQGQVSEGFGGIPRVVVLGVGGAVVALAIAALIAFTRRRARAGGQVAGQDPATTPHSRDESSGNSSL